MRTQVLDALARAAEGNHSAVRAELGVRGEPLLRGPARRNVARALSMARAHTRSTDDAHIARVAYLLAAERDIGDADDVDAVAATFAAIRPGRGRPIWWLTALIIVAAASVTGASLLWAHVRATAPPPPAAGVFATGGSTAPPAYAVTLADALTQHAVAIGQRRGNGGGAVAVARNDDEIARARAEVVVAAAPLGGAAAASLAALLDTVATIATSGHTPADATASLFAAVGAVNDELVAAGVPLYVDGDLVAFPDGSRLPYVALFGVEKVARYRAGGLEVRVLHVRKLDRMALRASLLGQTRRETHDALVLVDDLEHLGVGTLMPALADGGTLRFVTSSGDFPERPAIEARAGEVARRELAAAAAMEPALLVQAATPLARRREFFEKWLEPLRARGLAFEAPGTLDLPDEWRAPLAQLLPKPALEELVAIQQAVSDDLPARGAAAVTAALLTAAERREVQHRVDFTGPPLPMPQELVALRGGERSRDLLSAALADLARDPTTPGVGLTVLARNLFDAAAWRRPECSAAVVVFEGMGAELGLPPGHLIVENRVDRSLAARRYLELVDKPPEAVHAAAGRLWARLFGKPLVAIEPITGR